MMRTIVCALVAASLVACAVPFASTEEDPRRKPRDAGPVPEVSVTTIRCGPSLTTLPEPPPDLASSMSNLDPGTWTPVADMGRARHNAFAEVLPDGRVLVVGGKYQGDAVSPFVDELTAGIEIYDPARNAWSIEGEWPSVEPPVAIAMFSPTRVLVVTATSPTTEARMRVYDVEARTWSVLAAPPGRYSGGSSLTKLANGQFLLAGGRGGDATPRSALVYDAGANTWRRVESMRSDRVNHRASLLDDGRVVAIGGHEYGDPPIELYDPASGTWRVAAREAMQSGSVLWEYSAGFLTSDRRVIVPGWQSMTSTSRHPFAVLDLDCGRWEDSVYLPRPLAWFSLVKVKTTEFAMVGGSLGGTVGTNTYATPIFDSTTRHFRYLPPLPERRLGVTAIALDSEAILAFGGTPESCGTSCYPPSSPSAWLLRR